MQLDLLSATVSVSRINRDAGMVKATEHADRAIPEWSDRAYAFLIDFVGANPTRPFMTEEVRALAEENGLPKPPDNRAWGSVVVRAVKGKILRRMGYGQQHSVSCHMSPKSIWIAK